MLSPDRAVFAILSFEGPDRYAQAGGLGSRISGLCDALASAGYQTHLFFVGDPGLPDEETRCGGRLVLHRWCQWISAYHSGGVYDGEAGKHLDYSASIPPYLVEHVAAPAAAAGHHLFLLAEEWQTADALCRTSDLLEAWNLRAAVTAVWNANNFFGFDHIDWARLGRAATLTTVSRFMKHAMWTHGRNPLVVPNGIPGGWLARPDPGGVAALRAGLHTGGADPAFVKVGRWDPDKRWHMAVGAIAALRAEGLPARLVCKGGVGPHGDEVLRAAAGRGLAVRDITVPHAADVASLAHALAAVGAAPIVNVRGFLGTPVLQALYAAADAVLANSGLEPFGLVGLEAMAAGALVYVGATGEGYAIPLENALVVETDDPYEIARQWLQICGDEDRRAALRERGRLTAQAFRWERVLEILLSRLDYLAAAAGR